MIIEVLDKRDAKRFTCDTPWAAISVSTYPDDFPILHSAYRVGLLQLCFDDIDELDRWADHPMYREEYGAKLFSKEDAKAVWNFYESIKDKARTLLVHCEAGWSRSPAIAAAINRILCGNDNYYFQNYSPNMRVYRELLETHIEMYSEKIPAGN